MTREDWKDWAEAIEWPMSKRQADERRLNTHNMLRALIGFPPMTLRGLVSMDNQMLAQASMLQQHSVQGNWLHGLLGTGF